MPSYLGTEIKKMYLGAVEVTNMYLGSTTVFNSNSGPVITLIGDALIIIEDGIPYIDQGATASDKEDGDVTASIVQTGSTDVEIDALTGPESAQVIFDATDSEGFVADTVTRTINVIPPTVVDGLQIDWTDQSTDNEVTIDGEDMLYTNDGWITWKVITADGLPQILATGVGPYQLREITNGVTRCMLSKNNASSSFAGEIQVIGGANLISMNSMFRDLDQLTSIDLTGMSSLLVTDMANLFNGCDLIIQASTGAFDPAIITDITGMFAGCGSIEYLDFGLFDTINILGMASLFANCTSLKCITNLDTTSATSKTDMFYLCDMLQQPSPAAQIDLTDADGARWTNVENCPPTI